MRGGNGSNMHKSSIVLSKENYRKLMVVKAETGVPISKIINILVRSLTEEEIIEIVSSAMEVEGG